MERRHESSFDRAIKAYRENPTESNRLELLRAQTAHVGAFHSQRADEYIRRTR